MGQCLIMKIRGYLEDPLFYLRILTTCTVLSTALLIRSTLNGTLGGNTSGHLESLEVKVGELEVKATGKNITDLLMRYASMSRSSENNAFKGLY